MIKRKILCWYIGKELASPFVLGILVFTFILLTNKILKLVDMLINKGVSLSEISVLIWYLLPSFLVLTIPMSILLAILIALGKFSSDAELLAMKASGVSLYQLLPPFAALCIAGFLFTNTLTLYLLPKGNYAFRTQLIELAKKHSDTAIEEGVFIDSFDNIVLYINSFDKEESLVNGIFISDKRDPTLPTVVVAKHAVIISDKDNSNILFKLSDGSLHRFDQKSRSYQYALFNTYDMSIQLTSADDDEIKIKYKEMEIRTLIALSRERTKNNVGSKNIDIEINKRLAFPFSCLIFGLLGISLGGYWRRAGRSYGFIVSIVIVFLYYLFLNLGENMAKSGYLFAFMGIWMPNIILGSLGIYLFLKTAREKPLPLRWADSSAVHLASAIKIASAWLQETKFFKKYKNKKK
ncbi:MAG: LPS export ABC transporter permease LptF [Pseudomonadota bacterium]